MDLKANELHVRQRADIRKQIGVPKSNVHRRTTLREHKLKSGGGELVFPNYDGVISLPAIVQGQKRA